jgi:excisionase family DNA binding protein
MAKPGPPRRSLTPDERRRLREAAAAEHAAERELERAREELERLVLAARGHSDPAEEVPPESQVPWSDVAAATGISSRALQWRLQSSRWPSVQERAERERAERARRAEQERSAPAPAPVSTGDARIGPESGEPEAVTVSEAARRLGLTRKSVYRRIELGALETTTERGRTRVLLAPEPAEEGVGVTRAAELLGVTRATVYARIERGELAATTDPLGRVRVLGLN